MDDQSSNRVINESYCTRPDVHTAAGFTVAHAAVCSNRELVGLSTLQVGEIAGGVGGVAVQRNS